MGGGSHFPDLSLTGQLDVFASLLEVWTSVLPEGLWDLSY